MQYSELCNIQKVCQNWVTYKQDSYARSNLYNNLVYYSQLGTEDLNSKTLATYFQELNFNIIKYCEETYPVQSQYSIDFESETETSNKDKQKLKQYSKTAPNTPILPKTTAKHLQTPEQETTQTPNSPLNRFARLKDFTSPKSPTRQQKPLQTSSNLLDFLAENRSERSETAANEENDFEISEKESIDSENEEDKMTAYIAKIPEFNRKDIETSPQEWLNQVIKAGDANEWNATAFKTVFLGQFTNNNTSITFRNCFHNIKQELSESDKLIKKVHPHAPEDLNSAIQHAKRYEMAIEEANHTKLVNLAIGETSSAAEEKIDQLTKKVENYFTNQQQQSNQHYPLLQQSYYQPPLSLAYYPPRLQYQTNYYQSAPQPMQQQLIQQNQFAPQNQFATNNNKINPNNQLVPQNPAQPRPTHYHTQPSYFTIPKEQDFHHTALSEDRAAFKANESPFLLSNVAANKQKTITAMYTKAEVKGKAICLILDSGSAGSIITYQLMQQLKRNVDRPA
ncbi:hypothetical protein G9A89_000855 [Geosiphon pyriformis]|nr:hypothetical protein G9A89_000855 [Geosiphon pyriformis]